MKKFTYIFIVVSLIISAIFLTSCSGNKITYEIELPIYSEDDGFEIDVNGVFEEVDGNKYTVVKGENMSFTFRSLEGFTLKNLVVKNNGVVMVHVDESQEDAERYTYKIENISESHKITIEVGAEIKKYKLSLNLGKYRENQTDTVGKDFTDYDPSTIKVKYGDVVYTDLVQAVNDINNKNIYIAYGEKFEIWIGSNLPNYYQEYSYDYLYGYGRDFNGITSQLVDGKIENVWDTTALYTVNPEAVGGVKTYKDNMYKFVLEKVEADLNLYFKPSELRKSSFPIEYKSSDVLEISTSFEVPGIYPYATAGESFTLSFKLKENEVGFEHVDYKGMQVYINGYEITDSLELDSTDSNIVNYIVSSAKVPASFDPEELEKYTVTVKGIDLPKDDVTKIKAQASEANELINYIGGSLSGLPFYVEDGYHYYEKTSLELGVAFYMNGRFDYDNMIIKVNDKEFTSHSIDGMDVKIVVAKSGDGYEPEYFVDVSGVVLKQFTYKITNPYASEVDLYLWQNGVEKLITSEHTLTLVDGDLFELELKSKTENQNIVEYKFTGYDVENEQSGGIDLDATVEYSNRKLVGILVSFEANSEMRNITISK